MTFLRHSFLALIVFATTSAAQSTPQREPFATDSTGRMFKLAEGVFAITHTSATPDWPHGNTGVIIGTDGVLVIDTDYLPDRAEMDLALIRRVTQLPVRYLINTHWHGDHTHGNGIYKDAFPGLTIIGPRASAQFIELNLDKLPKGVLKPDSYTRTQIARLEAALAKGTDSAGRRYTAEERTSMQANIAMRRNEVAQMARVKIVPPNLLFDNTLTLDLGNRKVEIRDMGRANSPNDVIIYLPDERILFTGDILVAPLPFTIGSSTMPWINVLRSLESMPVTSLVPGHGPVMSNHDYTTLVRETFEMARSQIDSLFRDGISLTPAANAVRLPGQRLKFIGRDGNPIAEPSWEAFTRSIALQIAECYHGYRC